MLYIITDKGPVEVPEVALKNLDWTNPRLMWLTCLRAHPVVDGIHCCPDRVTNRVSKRCQLSSW
jgi:hypothetical protein